MNFFKRSIFDPIRGLTLDRLASQIDAFQNGYLAEFALTADAMENRDDMLKNVITKRKKAVTRHGWEILLEDCSDEARRQRDALDYFYRNLTCTHALRPNERGGFQLLIFQMMDAVGKGYAVHEILWKPTVSRVPSLSSLPSVPNSKLPNSGGTSYTSPKSFSPSVTKFREANNYCGATSSWRDWESNSAFSVIKPSPSAPSANSALNSPFSTSSFDRVGRRSCGAEFASSSNSSFDIRHSQLSSPFPSLPLLPSVKASAFRSSHFLSANFRFVPLWYFEATTGPLRFLTTPGALHGQPMAERDWLVTTGDALMIACSRAFLFKHYPLQAWLDFSEKFGLPGVRGITGAARGTPEFAEMEDALQSFMKELSVVTNTSESIDVIDLKGSGQPPFAELVERMDRVMASLWRGADLSTLSRDRGYGATLQEQESRILELDDARALSEHLNSTLDRWVLEQLFGPDVTPLARVKILVTPQECTPHDLAIDQFLIAHGARLPLSQTLERYGRVQAKPDEPALTSEWVTHASPRVPRGVSPRRPSESASNSKSKTHHSKLATPSRNGGGATVPRSSSSNSAAYSKIDHARVRPFSIENRQSEIGNPSSFMKTKLHNSTIATPTLETLNDGGTSSTSPTSSSPSSPCPPCLRGEFSHSTLNPQPSTSETASSANSAVKSSSPSLPSFPSVKSPFPNDSASATQSLDDFVQLSPLGLFPHANGFQNVDRTALETLVKNFKSFFGRLGRRFAGLPFYIGHPDVPGYENVYSDRKAYGWIMDLEVREDGLYGRTNWSAAGRELIANGHFKFLSPYWEAIRIGERNGRGVFSPTVLKSVGLTNQPNLPVLPLANSETDPRGENACLGTSVALATQSEIASNPICAPSLPSLPSVHQSEISSTPSAKSESDMNPVQNPESKITSAYSARV